MALQLIYHFEFTIARVRNDVLVSTLHFDLRLNWLLWLNNLVLCKRLDVSRLLLRAFKAHAVDHVSSINVIVLVPLESINVVV